LVLITTFLVYESTLVLTAFCEEVDNNHTNEV